MTLPSEVSVLVSARPAMPKSPTFTWPLRVIMMFWDFTSLWMMPRWCACESAARMHSAQCTASSCSILPFSAMISLSVSPSTYSSAIYEMPPASPASIELTTLGWFSLRLTAASRLKRSLYSGSSSYSSRSTLSATVWCVFRSNAR